MSLRNRLTLSFIIAVAVGFISLPNAVAQTRTSTGESQDDHDQTLKLLLTEVRELRIAIQRATVSGTRFQMLIERVRVEQARNDSLRRDLESLRRENSELQEAKPQVEQQIKDSEDKLERVTDPNGRADLESRIKSLKASLARIDPQIESLRNREAELGSELQGSQATLNELNGQLDALIRALKAP